MTSQSFASSFMNGCTWLQSGQWVVQITSGV